MRPQKPKLTVDERLTLEARRSKPQPLTDIELVVIVVLIGTVLGSLLVGVR